jgi:uncharacterized protein YegL
MAGEPLLAVENGVRETLAHLKKDPHSLETVAVGVIAFAAKAKTLVPLTELYAVRTPSLSLRPGTALGAALDLLRESISQEVVKSTKEVKGDYKPIVMILTDGRPTDDWRGPLARLKALKPSAGSIYGFGCGPEVDFSTLSQVCDVTFHLADLNSESLSKLFQFVTRSVGASVLAPETPISLEKRSLEEQGLTMIDKAAPPQSLEESSRIYVHLTCYNTRKLMLHRYKKDLNSSNYLFDQAFPLPDDFLADGSAGAPSVAGSKLVSPYGTPCPHCENIGWLRCGQCGALTCFDVAHRKPDFFCLSCGNKGEVDYNGIIDEVNGSAG